VNGAEGAKNGDTFCPVGADRIAFYSKNGARVSAPLPAAWKVQAIVALALHTDHAREVPVATEHGTLTVDAPAGQPIMVFRDGAAARKKIGLMR
jgi:hypothetical protein